MFFEFMETDSKNSFLLNIQSMIQKLFMIVTKNMKEQNDNLIDKMLEASEKDDNLFKKKKEENDQIHQESLDVNETTGDDDTFEDAIKCMEQLTLIFRLL